MIAAIVSPRFSTRFGPDIVAAARRDGIELELLALPRDPEARLDDTQAARADIAYFSSDVFPQFAKPFFSATRKAPGLKWLQVFNAGVDHPIFASILERGVRLTTSSGSAAEPISQTAIARMLYFARGFPRWTASQCTRTWNPLRPDEYPRDLRGQTMMIYGVGKIGSEIARLARVFGVRLLGVRRTTVKSEHVDEIHTPDKLAELLPACDWLTLACPLTRETRGIVDAAVL